MKKSFEVIQDLKKSKFKGDWGQLWLNLFLLKLSRAEYLMGLESFGFYYRALLPGFNLLGGQWALRYVSSQIWDISDGSQFPKILSTKLLGNSRGNTCTKFVILDTKFRFACGESDLY